MTRRQSVRQLAPWLLALLIWLVAGTACVVRTDRDSNARSMSEATVIVSESSDSVMQPLRVEPPQQQRWRDIGAVAYADGFRADFDYAETLRHRAEVRYQSVAPTLEGVVVATGLKPSFAYQLKLVGLEPLRGAAEGDNASTRAWSSWQLGRLGRWWCTQCQWNVPDAELARHVNEGHEITGYLLFDWFVTDAGGNADHPFALDSSLHVLWLVGQRERGPKDTAPRWYTVARPPEAYPPSAAGVEQQVGLFGEWEPDRPEVGEARLAAGSYEVGLNLTEESFHANMDEERTLEGGGFWAWVLQSEVQFEVRDARQLAQRSNH
jgi:hypothetical protein